MVKEKNQSFLFPTLGCSLFSTVRSMPYFPNLAGRAFAWTAVQCLPIWSLEQKGRICQRLRYKSQRIQGFPPNGSSHSRSGQTGKSKRDGRMNSTSLPPPDMLNLIGMCQTQWVLSPLAPQRSFNEPFTGFWSFGAGGSYIAAAWACCMGRGWGANFMIPQSVKKSGKEHWNPKD